MDLYDLRRNSRRTSMTRRTADRRIVPYPFGSPEWIENVKKNYVAWPKSNRRDVINRRNNERRTPDRRQQQLSEQRRSEKKYSRILLTQEEIKLIEDLYLSACFKSSQYRRKHRKWQDFLPCPNENALNATRPI